ncbi:tryptophan synthase subunit alpha [Janibacter hoylei]|uniref:tryptophan synthase subunit alpha n=1 Tax=Janibacter hoylei TaxID=364298 RepID=UPI0021A3199C|nr:tryptophan synthase subunit alpha [Janibacter hoylei]MCT1617764.1 tryptophan synthase subunit alpha [Janibacter hoylei]MCT2292433.1 tryptophan synthase subunit alpha [Janibacter hoylei]
MSGATSALTDVFARCRAEGRAALIGYLPVGYPDVEGSLAAVTALAEAGADIIEVGMPYSDPVMDGPVIQRAATEALAGGVHVDDVFRASAAARDAGAVPVVMSYWNLVLRRGVDRYAADLAAAGGAGMITPDLIPDEAGEWRAASERHGLDRIFLVAPSSTPERIATVTAACSGFVYTASTMGVTGTRGSVGSSAPELVARVRQATDLPLCVGLGVSNGAQAAEVASFADGVIVGSALVATLLDREREAGLDALRTLTAELAEGVRGRA